MNELNIETIKKISALSRNLCGNCFEITYAERRGYIIPEQAQKEKLQAIKDLGSKLTELLERL